MELEMSYITVKMKQINKEYDVDSELENDATCDAQEKVAELTDKYFEFWPEDEGFIFPQDENVDEKLKKRMEEKFLADYEAYIRKEQTTDLTAVESPDNEVGGEFETIKIGSDFASFLKRHGFIENEEELCLIRDEGTDWDDTPRFDENDMLNILSFADMVKDRAL